MLDLVLDALIPVALLIAAGHGLRRLPRLLAENLWPQAERLAYYVLLPALFVHSLATADMAALPVAQIATVILASTLLVAALMVALRPTMKVDGSTFTSIFQGSVRFNNYVGIIIAAGLFGAQGVALAAVCNAVSVPTVNLLSILVFARYGTIPLKPHALIRQILTNPLLLACAGGLVLRASGIGMPAALGTSLKMLGAAALPLGLLCVGAALSFNSGRGWVSPIVVASAAKCLLLPALTAILANALQFSGQALTVALVFQALPTASSAYILARQLGGTRN